MWNTAAATEHNAEPASASERRLAADGAAATEHSELSANAVERHTTAQSLPMHRWHCHGAACTATEHAATAALPAATAAATAATRTATKHAHQAEALMQTSRKPLSVAAPWSSRLPPPAVNASVFMLLSPKTRGGASDPPDY